MHAKTLLELPPKVREQFLQRLNGILTPQQAIAIIGMDEPDLRRVISPIPEIPPKGILYDIRTVNRLLKLDYSEAILKEFGPAPEPRDGFITFFDPKLDENKLVTLAKIHGKKTRIAFNYSGNQRPIYRTVAMNLLPGTFGFTPLNVMFSIDCCRVKLPSGHECADLPYLFMAALLYQRATGQHLFPDRIALTCSQCQMQKERKGHFLDGDSYISQHARSEYYALRQEGDEFFIESYSQDVRTPLNCGLALQCKN